MGSKRARRERPPAPSQIVNAAFEWASDDDDDTEYEPDDRTEESAAVDAAGRALLERLFGATDDCCPTTVTSAYHFTPADHARAVKVARAHPEVDRVLRGNGAVLGADQVWSRSVDRSGRQRVRVSVADYDRSTILHVDIEDDVVRSTNVQGSHTYPETPQEMGQAIAIARAHPELADGVRDLVGHAILRVPTDPNDPTSARRCMWVMFTEPDDARRQLPVQFAALVDIGERDVVAYRRCDCGLHVDRATSQGRPT